MLGLTEEQHAELIEELRPIVQEQVPYSDSMKYTPAYKGTYWDGKFICTNCTYFFQRKNNSITDFCKCQKCEGSEKL